MFFYTPENEGFDSCPKPKFNWRHSGVSQESLKIETIRALKEAKREGHGDLLLEEAPLSVCYPDELIDWLGEYTGRDAGKMTVVEALQGLTTTKHRKNPTWRRNTDTDYGGARRHEGPDLELRRAERTYRMDPSEDNRARLNRIREIYGLPYIYSLEHLEDLLAEGN